VVEATNECARVLHGLLRSLKPTTEAAATKEPIA